ncbi:hypothetical protein [Radiobacillus sp. PE A8.2]
MSSNEREELKNLLTKIHSKGYSGASLNEVMNLLKNELPKITRQKAVSVK